MFKRASIALSVISLGSFSGAFATALALSSTEDPPDWLAQVGLGLLGTSLAAWAANYPLSELHIRAQMRAAAAKVAPVPVPAT